MQLKNYGWSHDSADLKEVIIFKESQLRVGGRTNTRYWRIDRHFLICGDSRKPLNWNARFVLGLFLSLFSSDSLKLESNLQRTRPLQKSINSSCVRFPVHVSTININVSPSSVSILRSLRDSIVASHAGTWVQISLDPNYFSFVN